MIPKTLAAALIVMVGACSTADQAVVGAIGKRAQTGADTAAGALITATCGMTLGAYARLPSGDAKHGVALICGAAR